MMELARDYDVGVATIFRVLRPEAR
jgi:hypothetical protein